MRFALSAMAAGSGAVLFAAALFGQPEVYLRHARQQWDAWIDFEPSSPVAEQDEGQKRAALAARVQALQDEVNQLKDQLAAKQAAADLAQAAPPAPNLALPNLALRMSQAAPASVAMPDAGAAPSITVPERRAVATPAERREAVGKTSAAPPAKAPPARPEPDDMRSVLARLRQAPPAAVMDPPGERAKPVASPAMSRMIASQAAFSSGRVEDARRLLQEAQLLLVFRPPGSSSEDASAVSRGSINVARALEALGNNDIVRCRVFLDRAVDDMAGMGSDVPDREALGRRTGYAPAYPPR